MADVSVTPEKELAVVNPSSQPMELDPDTVEHRFADRMSKIMAKLEEPESDRPAADDDAVERDTRHPELMANEREEVERTRNAQPDPDDRREAPKPAAAPPQAPAAAAPPPAAPAPTGPDLLAIQQFQQVLQQRERELLEREKSVEALRGRQAEFEKMAEALDLMREKDALGALQALGFDAKEVIQAVAEGRGVSPGHKARSQVQSQLDQMRAELAKLQEREQAAVRQAQLQREQQAAFAEIAEAAKGYPVLAALGDAGRDTVLVHMDQEFTRTGRVPSYKDAAEAVHGKWVGLLRTLMSNPEARKALLGSEDDGHTGTTPTIETAASPERTRTKTRKMSEMTPDERLDYVWRNRHKATS